MRIAWLPLPTIEALIATFCIIGGLILFAFAGSYIAGGLVSVPSVFANFQQFSGPLIFGATYFFGGIFTLWGLHKGNDRKEEWGLLLMFFSLLLTWILTLMINGIVPLSWITVMFMSFICGVVYLHRRMAG
jgi:hypothetical protein